jgi:microcystin-dependent protein
MDELLGTIKLFAGNFQPKGYMICDGRLLSINQYTALYSILGTTYGGNGQTTFALPDLRGRVPVGVGQGVNLSPVGVGQTGGCESNIITEHHLDLRVNTVNLDTKTTGRDGSPSVIDRATISEQWTPIENRQPFVGMNYIICTEGYYPTRD